MLRLLIVLSIIIVPIIISYPYNWQPYPMDQIGYRWPNVPTGYNNYYRPGPYIVQLCNHSEWVCPKDPRRRRDHIPVVPSPGIQLKFCEYDEQCLDINDIPHKCCYDSTTNTRLCKSAIKRKV